MKWEKPTFLTCVLLLIVTGISLHFYQKHRGEYDHLLTAKKQVVSVEVLSYEMVEDTGFLALKTVIHTGFLVAPDKVITCCHGRKASQVYITVNGIPAEIIKENKAMDIMLLQTRLRFNVIPARVARKNPKELDEVFVLGSPMGLSKIIVKRRVAGFYQDTAFFIDGSVYTGNSGSPVYNKNWEVVGMAIGIRGDSHKQALGVAVARQHIYNILKEER